MIDMEHSDIWQGLHLGLRFKITHWGKGNSFSPDGTWNYYVFLPEHLVSDFESLWLPEKIIKTTPESRGFVTHGYSGLSVCDAGWHGGVTYYAKHGETVGYRCVELGCDYAHLFDRERGFPYDLETVACECRGTIEHLVQILGITGNK